MKSHPSVREKIYAKLFLRRKGEGIEEEECVDINRVVDKNIEQLNCSLNEKEVIQKKWINILKRNANKYGKVSEGNKIKIYNDGFSAFNNILKCIDKSKKRVWFETYIFDDSKLAEKVVNSLCNASRRGCDVILLVDYIGSIKMKNKWIKKLRENNVHVIFFNTFLNSFLNMLPIFFRDHRKILIVDNAAYCGSMNVSENVIPDDIFSVCDNEEQQNGEEDVAQRMQLHEKGRDKDNNSEGNGRSNGRNIRRCLEYYDLHIKLKGPAVKDLADVFIDSLRMSNTSITRSPIEKQKKYVNDEDEPCYVQILESNVLRKVKSIQGTFDYVLRNGASNNIYITTSYFLPPGFLRRALYSCLHNGVHISFLFSGNSDILGDVPATYYIIKKLLKKFHKLENAEGDMAHTGDNKCGKGNCNYNCNYNYNCNCNCNCNYNCNYNCNCKYNCNRKDCENFNHDRNKKLTNYVLHIHKNMHFENFIKYVKKKKKLGEHIFLRNKKKGTSQFFFFQNKHCHAKNLVVDNLWCATGSFNWDRFSSRRNLEVMVSIFDKKICDKFINEHKTKVRENSIEITLSHILNRNIFQILFSFCAYHLGKLSGKNIFDGLSNNSKKTVLRKAIINKYLTDNCIENVSLSMMWGF
ncbi:mitochondrial cardiolipin synthase, putative [Plasmodium malariae]|uniref:Mitochondrial cardiolipin synthase, putative n=1 Tax=Plasmodium malariae TaxID=5858 RepID=A0A1A8W870_PLAMA|nr:mitochondrial cardiolipin synthase, putative [Plasmodium malariae]SBS87379.1 mitochondrial cardiolipin synthase, putative (CLS) [Plasmodium malariae]SCO93281.1 mitochondrial cardiolipin synthase, putative [Plasmodium malariae]